MRRRLPGCFWSMVILNFQISRGSVATYLRWGGSLCNNCIENFLRNTPVKEFWKLVFICRSYHQKSQWLFFLKFPVPLELVSFSDNNSRSPEQCYNFLLLLKYFVHFCLSSFHTVNFKIWSCTLITCIMLFWLFYSLL